MKIVEDLKDRSEILLIGFHYVKPEHKSFIDKVKQEALSVGCWVTFAGEVEEND